MSATGSTVATDGQRTVAAVYVGRRADENLQVALRAGIWGWKTRPRDAALLRPGTRLLFGSGFTGGSPRRSIEEWERHGLRRVLVAEIETAFYEDHSQLWSDDVYPHRVRFRLLGELDDVGFGDRGVSRRLVDGFRRSAIANSLPSVVVDDSPLAIADFATASPRGRRATVPRRRAARATSPPTLAEIAAELRSALSGTGLELPDGYGGSDSLLAALVTKPFVILTGLSGSGKTQRALRLGDWFGGERCCTVAVRPDWTGPEALFGYPDALQTVTEDGRQAWAVPAVLEFVLAARATPDRPHLLLLDEMNLAHVERYFSDFLSALESGAAVLPNLEREHDGRWRVAAGAPRLVPLPRNLFVIGTVNVDETTYLFSPKVLDRATTFELRTATAELRAGRRRPVATRAADARWLEGLLAIAADDDWHLGRGVSKARALTPGLVALHRLLSRSGDEFGHRVYRESLRFAAALHATSEADDATILDHIVMLKILPRVHGGRGRVEPLLDALLTFARARRLPLTVAKLDRMLERVEMNQFVSFAE